MERIRAGRIAQRSLPIENNLSNNKNSGDYEENKKNDGNKRENTHEDISEVDKLLEELKKGEPTSDNLFYRLSIIAYEIGDLNRSIVYSERFKGDEKIRIGHLANGKLALADALTQLFLLCETLEWNFNEMRKLGAEHLKERHQDFKRDGWSDIK